MEIISVFWWAALLSAIVAYLLGSMNSAVVITKIFAKGADIRQMGSGNAGFTNVMRSVGKTPAILTMIFDLLKGVVSVLIGAWLFYMAAGSSGKEFPILEMVAYGKYIAGVFCMLGHMFPLYFHFKGGKGVVTAAALMIVEDYRVFFVVIAFFIIVFLITRIISISTLCAAFLLAPCTFLSSWFLDYLPYINSAAANGGELLYSASYPLGVTIGSLGIGVILFVMHTSNIKRLLKGEEKKLTIKK